MPLKTTKDVVVPPGSYRAVITNSELTTKTFDPGKGPEDVVEITFQPQYPSDGNVLPLSIVFSPIVNGISALSRFLKRIGQEPDFGAEDWDETSIIGVEVMLSVASVNGFARVQKDSIIAAK